MADEAEEDDAEVGVLPCVGLPTALVAPAEAAEAAEPAAEAEADEATGMAARGSAPSHVHSAVNCSGIDGGGGGFEAFIGVSGKSLPPRVEGRDALTAEDDTEDDEDENEEDEDTSTDRRGMVAPVAAAAVMTGEPIASAPPVAAAVSCVTKSAPAETDSDASELAAALTASADPLCASVSAAVVVIATLPRADGRLDACAVASDDDGFVVVSEAAESDRVTAADAAVEVADGLTNVVADAWCDVAFIAIVVVSAAFESDGNATEISDACSAGSFGSRAYIAPR